MLIGIDFIYPNQSLWPEDQNLIADWFGPAAEWDHLHSNPMTVIQWRREVLLGIQLQLLLQQGLESSSVQSTSMF